MSRQNDPENDKKILRKQGRKLIKNKAIRKEAENWAKTRQKIKWKATFSTGQKTEKKTFRKMR